MVRSRFATYLVFRRIFRIVAQPTIRFKELTGPLGVLSEIRRLPDAIHRLTSTVQALANAQRETGPSEERLDELERSRAMWEAEMEAGFLRAESKYKAAAAAEARAKKQNDKLDIFDQEGPEVEAGIPPEYAVAGEAEGLHDVRVDVAPRNSKDLARRLKFL